jgi:hypothetical protein
MNIGLVQADGKLPNLALMQICAFHEMRGDKVSWWQGPLFNEQYHKIYVSKIFSFSSLPASIPTNAIIGGTGIDFYNRLPDEMQVCAPSYSLYPGCRYHVGFSMKGCRFACKFCCVPKKEGRPKENSGIDGLLLNPRGGDKLMLLDNDFFGGPNWKINLERIIELRLKVCFVQGLNIRIITGDQAELLARCNYMNSKFNKRYLTFAWDRFQDRRLIEKGLQICKEAGILAARMQFFVLIGFDTSQEEDYERVMTLKEWGCMPFVMPYNRDDPYQKAFARWVNHRAVFNSCRWEEYRYRKVL